MLSQLQFSFVDLQLNRPHVIFYSAYLSESLRRGMSITQQSQLFVKIHQYFIHATNVEIFDSHLRRYL